MQRVMLQRRQLELVRCQRDAALQQRELRWPELGRAEVQHLAFGVQRRQGLGQRVDIHQRIRPVEQQQVEVVGTQCTQRLLDRGPDARGQAVAGLGPRCQRTAGSVRVHQPDAALADQLHPVAQRRAQCQRLAEQRLDAAPAVEVGMVEAGHTQLEVALDPGQALLRGPTPFGQPPGASDDRRQRRRVVHQRHRQDQGLVFGNRPIR